MDAPAKAKRPWWKTKRWRFALATWLLLPVFYPLSLGPLLYLNRRGCFPGGLWLDLYAPIPRLVGGRLRDATHYREYLDWWAQLADRHSRR